MNEEAEWEAVANAPMPPDTIAQRIDSMHALLFMLCGTDNPLVMELTTKVVEAGVSSIQAKAAELRDLKLANDKRARL